MATIRLNENRRLYLGGPTKQAPIATFREEMDKKIRAYQLDHPSVRHITNHPKSAPQNRNFQMLPHIPPANGLTPDYKQPDPRRSSQTINWGRLTGQLK
jgi:hypothetical protein